MATQKLAKAVSEISFGKLPSETVWMTKKCILDWLGCSIRGWGQPGVKMLSKVIGSAGGTPVATLLDGGDKSAKTSALHAALLNAAASHVLDFDDLHNASIVHLGTIVVPAAWSLAELEGKSGKELLAAVVAGYEAGARIGEAVNPESYFFWHTTGTVGTFAAAAAAGNILRLDEQGMVNCLGSAGTQASGLWEFLIDGAMSKILHIGKAAFAGVLSAQLAQEGFTGAQKILEGEKAFCLAMSPNPHWDSLSKGLGQGYKIDENSFKPYACCKHCHPTNYAVQLLRQEHGLKLEQIALAQIRTNSVVKSLVDNDSPQNPYGCKFSIQYCLAAMLKFGKLGVDEFKDEYMNDPEVQRMMKHVLVEVDSKLDKEFKERPERWSVMVRLTDKAGDIYEKFVEYPKGDPPNPLSWKECVAKFTSLVEPVYGKEKTQKLCALVENLETVEDFSGALDKCFK